MRIDGVYQFEASREAVFPALLDPAVLAHSLPGTERLALTGPDQYEGRMVVRVGPFRAAFDVRITIRDKQAPDGYRMIIDGAGRLGQLEGEAVVRLSSPAPATTDMRYTADLTVRGAVARVGERLLDALGHSISRDGLDALAAELSRRLDTDRDA